VKLHPRVSRQNTPVNYEKLLNNCEQLPDYIPVELLLGNVKKSVISVYSTALIAASQLEQLKAISLLELVQWKDRTTQNVSREWLTKESKGKIIFARTFTELKELLEA
jgi:hypothetical protein